MNFPTHLRIESKIPYYFRGEKNSCKRKIQEIMREYGYDEDFVDSIDEEFCKGFGVARDIVFEFLKEEYWRKQEAGSATAQAAEVWEEGEEKEYVEQI